MGPPHPCIYSSSHLTWAHVALVRLIKDTEDIGGKTHGEVEILREMTGERDEAATQGGAGTVAAEANVGRQAETEGKAGSHRSREGAEMAKGERRRAGQQRQWEK